MPSKLGDPPPPISKIGLVKSSYFVILIPGIKPVGSAPKKFK
jgi:hypothetical protein